MEKPFNSSCLENNKMMVTTVLFTVITLDTDNHSSSHCELQSRVTERDLLLILNMKQQARNGFVCNNLMKLFFLYIFLPSLL